MPAYTVWMLEKSNITVSDGGSLNGITQGTGEHLPGRTITLNNNNWKETSVFDTDTSFEDNDSSQTLNGSQTINGVNYANGTRVEAEYSIVLRDPATGNTWTAYAYNVNDSNPAYATVEGLMLRPDEDGNYPPVGVALEVVSAKEGPTGLNSNLYDLYDTPPCFTPGTLIDTPDGPRPVEILRPGDLVLTRDSGAQPLRWVGQAQLSAADLRARPQFLPIRILVGALGDGLPKRPLVLSPQHRLLFSGWRAELLFAEAEVLVPAVSLLGDNARRETATGAGVHYLHLLFDRHEIIFAEGAPVESLLPAWLTDATLPPALRAELALLGSGTDADRDAPAAYTCLTRHEGRLLAQGWCG